MFFYLPHCGRCFHGGHPKTIQLKFLSVCSPFSHWIWISDVTCFDQWDLSKLRANKFLPIRICHLRTLSEENILHAMKKFGLGYWILRWERERSYMKQHWWTQLVIESFLHHLSQYKCQLNAADWLSSITVG